jgi:hypothetical protein
MHRKQVAPAEEVRVFYSYSYIHISYNSLQDKRKRPPTVGDLFLLLNSIS